MSFSLTKRALDVWDSAAFSSFFLASSVLCSQEESTPAPSPVTQTVGRLQSMLSQYAITFITGEYPRIDASRT
jgi:hypothetical protein